VSEEYVGERMQWFAAQDAFFKKYSWLDSDEAKLRLVVRAKFYRKLGNYKLAEQYLNEAKGGIREPAAKVLKRSLSLCDLYDEELELRFAMGKIAEVQKAAEAVVVGLNSKGPEGVSCRQEFYELWILSLLAQNQVDQALNVFRGARLQTLLQGFTLAKIYRRQNNPEAVNALKKSLDIVHGSAGEASWTAPPYYSFKEQLLTSVYLKNKELFISSSAGVTSVLSRRRDNTYLEPMISAWLYLGRHMFSGAPFKKAEFDALLKEYAKKYGVAFPELAEIRGLAQGAKP
jgi:hypothetical protein